MKNKNVLIISGILIVFLILGFTGYYLNLNSKKEPDSVDKYIKDGYTLLDLNSLESKLSFVGEIREFNVNEEYVSLKTITEKGEETLYDGAKIKLENGKVTMIFGTKEEKVAVSDVKKVYISNVDCYKYTTIYLLTNKGLLYEFNQKKGSKKIEDYQMGQSEFAVYNDSVMYDDILEWKVRDEKCGYSSDLVGVTKDNERYLAALEEKFDYVDKINDLFIKSNRDIDFALIKDKKFKFLLGYSEDQDEYIFLTEDNYLYSTKEYELENSKPVKKIYKKNNQYVVVFDNDETKTYNL